MAAPESAPRSRSWMWWGLAVVFILALGWRLPVERDVEGVFQWYSYNTYRDNDSLYQLQRVTRCLSDYPSVAVHDPASHHPDGTYLHWPAGLPFLQATLATVTRQVSQEACAALLSWLPVLAGLGVVALTLLATRARGNAWGWGLLAALLVATSPHALRVTLHGRIDHHHLDALLLMLLVWARFSGRPRVWVGAALGLFLVSPEAPFTLTVLVGVELGARVVYMVLRGEDEPGTAHRSTPWVLWLVLAAIISYGIDVGLGDDTVPREAMDPYRPSAFSIVWFGLLAVGAVAVAETLSVVIGVRRRALAALGIALLVVGLLVGVVAGTSELESILTRLARSGRIVVSEERSPFALGAWGSAHSLYLLLLAAAGFVQFTLLTRAVGQGGAADELRDRGIMVVAVLLGLLESRHLNIWSPVIMIAFVDAMATIGRHMRVTRFQTPGPVLAALLVGIALPGFLLVQNALSRVQRAPEYSLYESSLEAAQWFESLTPEDRRARDAVYAPWHMGHHLNVLGQHPVVVDPFSFPEPIEGELQRVWLARTERQLDAELEAMDARYLVLTDPVTHILEILTATGGDVSRANHIDYATNRVYATCGLDSAHLQPRYLSETVIRGRVWRTAGTLELAPDNLPLIQIYERKPGATVRGQILNATDKPRVEYRVELPVVGEVPRTRDLELDEDGFFHYLTALPVPYESGGISIRGPCTLRVGEQAIIFTIPQQKVDHGGVVDLGIIQGRAQ